jgi:hypothetical protein
MNPAEGRARGAGGLVAAHILAEAQAEMASFLSRHSVRFVITLAHRNQLRGLTTTLSAAQHGDEQLMARVQGKLAQVEARA